MLTKRDFEEWCEAQDVRFELVAYVDDELVGKVSSSIDAADAASSADKLQHEVDTYLLAEWSETPDEDTL